MTTSWTRRAAIAATAATAMPVRAQPAGLDTLRARVAAGDFRNIHSVLVQRRGETLVEWYFPGSDQRWGQALGVVPFEADTLHDVRSITKSFTSMLFGAALADGLPLDPEQPLMDHFRDFPEFQTAEKRRIRLRHVLTMTTGLRWDETLPWTDPMNGEAALESSLHRVRHILSLPVVAPPGERWAYSAGDPALIAEVVARAAGLPIEEYARRRLLSPLGISRYDWVRSFREGAPMAGSGLRLTPRDMAKLGNLMLAGGVIGRRRLIPKAWVEASTRAQTIRSPTPYGYFWWPGQTPDGRAMFRATGNGGQRIVVIPGLDAVAVITAGMYGDRTASDVVDRLAFELLGAVSPVRP
jgi:CubicO group peptidase (beta-lactamase class C family)